MSELEKVEVEIAKVKLAQEKLKLAQQLKKQEAISKLGQSVGETASVAATISGSIAKYIARWFIYLLITVLFGLIAFTMHLKPFGNHPDGFIYTLGFTLGSHDVPITISLLTAPTLAAFFPLSKLGKGNVEGLLILIPAIVFAIWYFA